MKKVDSQSFFMNKASENKYANQFFFVQFVQKSLIFGLINPTIPVLNIK